MNPRIETNSGNIFGDIANINVVSLLLRSKWHFEDSEFAIANVSSAGLMIVHENEV